MTRCIEVCIHRDVTPKDPIGHMIDGWTRAVNQGPWVLEAGPATHAFLAVDGFRLDAAPPLTRWHLDSKRPPAEEARWELPLDDTSVARLLKAAGEEDGKPYDMGEITQQALTPVLREFGKLHGLKGGRICTTTVLACIEAAGIKPHLDNHAPESLGAFMSKHGFKRTY